MRPLLLSMMKRQQELSDPTCKVMLSFFVELRMPTPLVHEATAFLVKMLTPLPAERLKFALKSLSSHPALCEGGPMHAEFLKLLKPEMVGLKTKIDSAEKVVTEKELLRLFNELEKQMNEVNP